MLDIQIDGKLQVIAACSLLQRSELVKWERDSGLFVPTDRTSFEYCAEQLDKHFGRLICWITFAAGAEFLAKGVCLLNAIDFREAIVIPEYPIGDVDTWITNYQTNSPGIVSATSFGTLGTLLNRPLRELCKQANASPEEKRLILAAYSLLSRSIRNRDAHAYVPKVRDQHFPLVSELFAKSFNLLVSWVPGGTEALNTWVNDAGNFIASL